MLLLAVLPSVSVPRAFLFKARNTVGWVKWLTGNRGRVYLLDREKQGGGAPSIRRSRAGLHTKAVASRRGMFLGWLLNLTSQQHARVSQGPICSDKFTCCHTETEVADQTVYLTQSQYTDTGLTSPSTDPITPGAWQGSRWRANFQVTCMTRPGKIPIRTPNLPLSSRTP